MAGPDRQWETSLEHPAAVVPVQRRLEFEPRGVRPEADVLRDPAVAEAPLDANGNPMWSGFHDRDRFRRVQLLTGHGVAGVDLPGIPIARLVHVRPELVPTPRQHLTVGLLVAYAGQRTVVGKLHTKKRVLEMPGGNLERVSRRAVEEDVRAKPWNNLLTGQHVSTLHTLRAGKLPLQLEAEGTGREIRIDGQQ